MSNFWEVISTKNSICLHPDSSLQGHICSLILSPPLSICKHYPYYKYTYVHSYSLKTRIFSYNNTIHLPNQEIKNDSILPFQTSLIIWISNWIFYSIIFSQKKKIPLMHCAQLPCFLSLPWSGTVCLSGLWHF